MNRDIERAGRLVRDEEGRLLAQCHRDHDSLPHPTRELVRIKVEDCLRIVDPHQAEVLQHILPIRISVPTQPSLFSAGTGWEERTDQRLGRFGRRGFRIIVRLEARKDTRCPACLAHFSYANSLDKLVVDSVSRIQRIYGLLENHADAGPSHQGQFPLGQSEHIDPAEHNFAPTDPGRRHRQETGNRVREGALPAPGLPDDPCDPAGRHLEGDVPECMKGARPDLVVDGQVLDPQNGVRHRVYASALEDDIAIEVAGTTAWVKARRLRGSRMSRRPSPSKLNARTVTKIASPGKMTIQGNRSR